MKNWFQSSFKLNSHRYDVYIPAAACLSVGGMGFFFSHFVLAEHFAADHFGLVHSLINCAFDASTATFTVLELMHRAGRVATPGVRLWLHGLQYAGCHHLLF